MVDILIPLTNKAQTFLDNGVDIRKALQML
jgi:hypothetical protein